LQNQDAVSLTKMKKWIGLASWKPVPGGLMSDAGFKANVRRFDDQSDTWTRLTVFGIVGANNAGRHAEGQARKVNENYHIMTFQIVSSNGLRHVILSFEFLSVLNDRLHAHRRRARQSGLKRVPQSGEQWQIPPIGRLLLPSVLLLPIRPRAGAHSRRTRCAPPPHARAPASRPLLHRCTSLLMPALQRQAAASHASSSSGSPSMRSSSDTASSSWLRLTVR
jgi:hypothetical protein